MALPVVQLRAAAPDLLALELIIVSTIVRTLKQLRLMITSIQATLVRLMPGPGALKI